MIFVDTSGFLALTVGTDEHHLEAVQWWKGQMGTELVTSNLVVIETLGWVRHKIGKAKAVTVGEAIFQDNQIAIKRVSLLDEQKAWDLFCKVAGRGVSMIDCTSFVVMKRLKVKQAFTFDEDFAKAGFEVRP